MALRHWSWVSNEFSLLVMGAAPVLAPWVTELSYQDGVETELVRGAGRSPLGTTDPTYMPGDGSITVLAREWRLFLQGITGGGVLNAADLEYAITIKRALTTLPIPITDRVDFVLKTTEDSNASGSADVLKTTVAIQVVNATRNGIHV